MLFWAMLTMAMVGGACYNLAIVTTKYFDYPVAVSLSIQHATDLSFPAVSLCNMNPIKASAYNVSNGNATSSSAAARRRRKRSTSKLSRAVMV
jgi:hypothetical protein